MSENHNQISDFVSTLRGLDVDNVFIYVGDAVRYDYLPDKLSDEGGVFKTIAASTHSPTSFASLVTGQPAFVHGVSSFKNRIHDDVFRLFDVDEYHTEFVNSILHKGHQDPIFSVLGAEPDSESGFPDDVPEPYIVMERGQGGHAPYSSDYSTAGEYFRDVKIHQADTVRQDYKAAIESDVQDFFQRLEQIGVGEETLVIYTSDHGELLGEGGMFGHTSPMRPELVYVPTVFIHPNLPTGSFDGILFRHIDLLPTILEILGYDKCGEDATFDSSFFSDEDNGPAVSRYKLEFLSVDLPQISGELRFEGVWDYDGGIVFPRSSFPDRLAFLVGKLSNSDKRSLLGRHFVSAIRSYLKGETVYGSPSISRQTAEELLESVPLEQRDVEERDLSDDDMEHLRDLGYL